MGGVGWRENAFRNRVHPFLYKIRIIIIKAIEKYIKPMLAKGHREGQKERTILPKLSSTTADKDLPTLSIPVVIFTLSANRQLPYKIFMCQILNVHKWFFFAES